MPVHVTGMLLKLELLTVPDLSPIFGYTGRGACDTHRTRSLEVTAKECAVREVRDDFNQKSKRRKGYVFTLAVTMRSRSAQGVVHLASCGDAQAVVVDAGGPGAREAKLVRERLPACS